MEAPKLKGTVHFSVMNQSPLLVPSASRTGWQILAFCQKGERLVILHPDGKTEGMSQIQLIF